MNAEQKEKLDDYHFMFGAEVGNLAMALDQLTEVMAMLGQHKVHCRVEKGPRSGEPPLDLVTLLDVLQSAKGLVQEAMVRLQTRS
jgi:hypothetical protein